MRRLRPFPIAACLLPLVLTACGDSSSVDDPRTHAPLVRSAAVQGASDVSRSFTGVVAARVQGDLGFRVSGKVQERLVDTGQSVKRGQPLMRLDPIDLRLQAQAQHASVIAIRARAKQTADDEARYRNLVAAGAVSASTYDQIKAAADTAKAQLSAAHAQADVASNASGYAVLLADADGVVVETLAEPGQVVSPGQPVLRLARAGQREAIVHLPETLRPAPGSTAQATLYGNTTGAVTAKLRLLSDSADRMTRTFEARYVLEGALANAPIGSTVTLRIFALVAAHEALEQAGWRPITAAEQERTATVIASGVGGFGAIADAVRTTDTRGPRRLSPFTAPSFLANMAAGHLSINYGFKGPLGAPVTACAAGVQAIGDAARIIRSGEADIAICGGTEAAIDRVTLGCFAAARALSTGFAEHPQQASRPFDRDRDGFVMSEGAGLLVIETLEHALARGATPLAELVGYGTSADAYHLTAGPADGSGARRAMEMALRQAAVSPADVQHINAHATSTPVGDRGELAAIHSLFGADSGVAISATKSATGHLLGAAGGVEAIFTVLALRDQIAPPTLNLMNPDEAASGLNLVALQPRNMPIDYALSNGFGFGGVNASLLFRRWHD